MSRTEDVSAFVHRGVTLDHPSGWWRDHETAAREAEHGLVLLALGPSGVDGLPYRLSLMDQPREDRTVRSFGRFVAETRPMDLGGRWVEDGPAAVAGVDEAWRVVTDYPAEAIGGGPPLPARWVDLLWLAGDRQLNLRLTGPVERMDGAEAAAVIRSLRVA